jgi:MscS family membrane protein
MTVRFRDFAESSLDVEVTAWFQTVDADEFTAIKQELFLAFIGVVERVGARIAAPARTVRMESART